VKDNDFIWDEKETRAVRFSFIRNFTLDQGDNCIHVTGWFNDSESFHLKTFRSYEEAQVYVRDITEKTEKKGDKK
jgi:hypothetical protein